MQPEEQWRMVYAQRALELRSKEQRDYVAKRVAERTERQTLNTQRREAQIAQEKQRKLESFHQKILLSARLRTQHQRLASRVSNSKAQHDRESRRQDDASSSLVAEQQLDRTSLPAACVFGEESPADVIRRLASPRVRLSAPGSRSPQCKPKKGVPVADPISPDRYAQLIGDVPSTLLLAAQTVHCDPLMFREGANATASSLARESLVSSLPRPPVHWQ